MKKLIIPLLIMALMSSCIIEVDMTPSNVQIIKTNEYETKVVVNEVWSGGRLVYEEFYYLTYLTMEFVNTGGMTARNIRADITFYDGPFTIKTTSVFLSKLYSGDRYNYDLKTGFESIYDYTDYNVTVHWD